jgi:hypothetical protein
MGFGRIGRTLWCRRGALAGTAVMAVAVIMMPAAAASAASPGPVKGTAAKPFRIVKLEPQHIIAHANGTYKNLKIVWAGKGTFPITVYSVPKPGCTHAGVTCYSNSHTFMSGTHTLNWKKFAGCGGGLISSRVERPSTRWTGHWGIHLKDAANKKTKALTFTLTCII